MVVVGTSAFDSSQIVVESRSNFVKTDHTTFKCPSRHGAFFRIFQTIRFAADATRERTASRNEVEEFREPRGCGQQFPGRVEVEVQVFFLRRNTLPLLVPRW